jgi:hypothetical protein
MTNPRHWIDLLEDEDVAFLKRFVLASGSLKELAEGYGISYPTVRLRLDRLIAKVKVFESHQQSSDFERLVRAMYADNRIDQATLKQILKAHQREKEMDDAKSRRGTTDDGD